ncbi:MAG TPA: DUF3999 family protein [Candidatus Limnocylindrales bacterium]|nr:DUF3999 family protein [Candidatus Limnocylindrales bacterium]
MSRRVLVAAVIATGLFQVATARTTNADMNDARPRRERSVMPGAAGPNRLPVDVPLLAGARPLRLDARPAAAGGLDDLRLYDGAGREVPWLMIPPAVPDDRWEPGRVLPVVATKETSGFELDLGQPLRVDRVRLAGMPAPFLKRLRVEASGDRSRWTLVVEDGTVFDLPDEGLRHTELAFPAGEFQYFRVTWDDRSSAVVPLPQSVSARIARTGSAPATPAEVPIEFERRASEPRKSRFRLHLPGAHLPVTALVFHCGGSHLLRDVRVSEGRLSGSEVVPVTLGEGTLRRAVRGDLVAADLRIAVAAPEEPDLDVVVDDGDNPALDLTGVSVELAPLPWIYFESAAGEPLTARYGDPKLSAPRYDLEAMRAAVGSAAPVEARWGAPHDVATTGDETAPIESSLPAVGATIDTSGFRYSRPIPDGPPGLTALALDAAVLAHSRNLADVRIVDGESRQVPYLVEKLDEPLSLTLAPFAPAIAAAGKPRAGQSRYELTLPYENMPPVRLVITTGERVFERRVSVEIERPPRDPRAKLQKTVVASSPWQHADPDSPAPALVLGLPPVEVTSAQIVVDEGDNSPLALAPPRLLLPLYRLRFFRSGDDALRLVYGERQLGAPRYDLALLAPRLVGARAAETMLGAETGSAKQPQNAGATQPMLFWGALLAAIVVLLGLVARLVRKAE